VIAAEVVRTRVNIPRASGRSINTVEVSLSDIVGPVVLGDISSIRRFKRLILDLGGIKNRLKQWQRLILQVSASIRKSVGIKTEERTQDTDITQSTIDKVLIRASKIIIDDPMKIALVRDKAYIDERVTFVDDACRLPN
jgi:hypothetical protein